MGVKRTNVKEASKQSQVNFLLSGSLAERINKIKINHVKLNNTKLRIQSKSRQVSTCHVNASLTFIVIALPAKFCKRHRHFLVAFALFTSALYETLKISFSADLLHEFLFYGTLYKFPTVNVKNSAH